MRLYAGPERSKKTQDVETGCHDHQNFRRRPLDVEFGRIIKYYEIGQGLVPSPALLGVYSGYFQ
jgi:hypothetical protein